MLYRYHRGTTVVVHNIRDLCTGEAITENYGPMFMFHPKKDRQHTLKTRYNQLIIINRYYTLINNIICDNL